MTFLWTNISADEATGGKSSGTWHARRIEIDSRKIQPGDLFVAIKGENHDGHDFVADAFAKGAAAAMISSSPHRGEAGRGASSRDVSASEQGRPLPNPPPTGAGVYLMVADTMRALEDLARFARARSQARVVGVTGSVGKTSAKDMLKLALSMHGKTYATTGNFNNHIGTPLNLANLPPDAQFAVFEMGMNHAGEIAHLTRLVRPHIAAITNVESVHLEFFDSQEGIADAKAEIFEGMEKSGVAVLNADSRHLGRLKMAAARNNVTQVVTFGEHIDANVRLIGYQPMREGSNIDASLHGELVTFALGAAGMHFAKTALMTLAVTHALGLDDVKTAGAMGLYAEPEGRGQLKKIAAQGGEATLIDDSYNASPVSMKAAIAKTVELWEGAPIQGRKIAALGDMLELGKDAPAFHTALAAELQRAGFDKVYASGTLMKYLYDALPSAMRGAHVLDAEELPALLAAELKAKDWLLVKGSHGSKIHKVAQAFAAAQPSGEKKHAV